MKYIVICVSIIGGLFVCLLSGLIYYNYRTNLLKQQNNANIVHLKDVIKHDRKVEESLSHITNKEIIKDHEFTEEDITEINNFIKKNNDEK